MQICGGDAAHTLRQAERFWPSLSRSDRTNLDYFRGCIVADRFWHELYGAAEPDADNLHVLQLGFSHLVVNGFILYSMHRHARTVLQNVPIHSPDGAQVTIAPKIRAAANTPVLEYYSSSKLLE